MSDCAARLKTEAEKKVARKLVKLPMKLAAECQPCRLCGEPWCRECRMHYADCKHPGPHSEDDE